MIKKVKNIKFDKLNAREKKDFGFQNLKKKKLFLNIKIIVDSFLSSRLSRDFNI